MPPLPPFDVNQPWVRKLDDTSQPAVATPVRRYRPDSLADLIAIVQDAERAADPALELRAVGSHWALSTAAVTQHYIVETADPNFVTTGDPDIENQPWLNSTLYDVIPGCLSSPAHEFFSFQGVTPYNSAAVPDHSKFYLYHVEAGTRIWELYSRLDAGDDKGSLAADLTKYMGPWAMETLGGAGGQTVVGAFATGTHGGDVHLPPIADAVQAIHLVGADGKQYWFEQLLPNGASLVDDDKLRTLYGSLSEIEIVRDPDRFHAVLIAAGRMGIIYSVVLRVVRQYALHEVRTADTWSSVKSWVNNPAAPIFTTNRFVQVLINPNPQLRIGDDHSCYVTVRTLEPLDKAGIPEPRGRAERGKKPNAGNSVPLGDTPGDFYDSICTSDSPARSAIDLIISEAEDKRDDALSDALKYTALLLFLPNPVFELARDAAVATATLAQTLIFVLELLRESFPAGPLGRTMALICIWAAETDNMEIFRRIAEAVLASAQKPNDPAGIAGISYGVMDIHNYLDVGCSANGDSLEVFFDAANPNLVVFIERLFQRMKELENGWLTGTRLAFAGYVALRFMTQSAALLAMQQFPRTCSLEIAGYLNVPGTIPFLTTIEQDAINLGATIHWGQRNDLTMKQVEQMYDPKASTGKLFVWRGALSKITDNGRLALFSTPFTRKRGLEVVQPIIQGFAVNPANGCAGKSVQVAWTASANPPGTVASLEFRRAGSSGPPDEAISLATLNGVQDVMLPAGRSDFTLVIATTLNGRTLEDRRTVQVEGFSDHGIWKILRSGMCLTVDANSRWGVELSFADTVAPALVVEELYCNFTSAATWTVRRTGLPDMVFSPATSVQVLQTRPTLQGTWLFFVNAVGCGGGPPLFAAEFRLVCDR